MAIAFALMMSSVSSSVQGQLLKGVAVRSSNGNFAPSALPVVVSAPTAFKTTPSTFVVPIDVGDITGLGINSYQFNLQYDPTVIDPTGANFGCSTTGTLTGNAGLAVICNVLPDGTLRVAVFGSGTMTGSGTILNITFATDPSAVPGNISPLTFDRVSFFAGVPAVANSPVNGQITLTGRVQLTAPILQKPKPAMFVVPINVNDVSSAGVFAFQFDLVYDPDIIDPFGPNFGCSTTGTIAGAVGMAPTCNVSPDGTVRVSVSGPIPMNGSGTILNIYFTTDPMVVPEVTSPLNFSNALFFNSSGLVTSTAFNGEVKVQAPTAAGSAVSGRVLDTWGRPLPNVRITISNGMGISRQVVSSPFGYYAFEDLPTGDVYVLEAAAKRYVFQPRVISLSDDVGGLDLIAEP